jgi:2-polyprenyl-3-methyl-5-hydroxy-6-metoxy-1,4-benzoquinol methylase
MNKIKQHFEEHAETYLGTAHQLDAIWSKRLPIFRRYIEPSRDMRLLDVGGGAGDLADRLLTEFPRLEVTIVDVSQALLNHNRPHPRKELICREATAYFADQRGRRQYDMVNFDVLLHHILTPGSFRQTRNLQRDIIGQACELLVPDGLISIREIVYQTLGLLPERTTHRLLWFVSTRRLPRRLTELMHRMGMASQGGGVAFFSRAELLTILRDHGLQIEDVTTFQIARPNWKFRLVLAKEPTDIYVMARKATSNGNSR